uniref:Uncharacterized protein n=1 Tax=viral metagenome TaxID=1070528 RepID=A0A6C0EK69_9ZZZZ
MDYKELILLISETIKSKRDRNFIVDNIEVISQSFLYLNKTIKKINTIITNSGDYLTKLNKIQLMGFNPKETMKLINIMGIKGIVGGAQPGEPSNLGDPSNPSNLGNQGKSDSIDSVVDSQINKIPNLMLAIPKNIIDFLSSGLENISHLFLGDGNPQDFKEPLDIIYIFLFITASIPIVGALSDFITICRAFKQKKEFLAIITVISRFLSFFTLNSLDLGLLFKIFYSLDSYSYQHYSKLKIKNNI